MSDLRQARSPIEPEPPAEQLRRRWRRAGPVVLPGIAILLLAIVVWAAGPRDVLAALGSARPSFLALAALATVLATLVGAGAAYLLAGRAAAVPLRTFLMAYWGSWALGQVVPGQVADMASMAWMLRRRGIPATLSLGQLAIDKAVSLLVALAAAAALVLLLRADLTVRVVSASAAAAALALLIALIALPAFETLLARRRPRRRSLALALDLVTEAARSVRRTPLRVAANVVLTLAKFAATGLSYWAAFAAVGHVSPDPLAITAVGISAGLVAYLPLSMNGVGTVELAGLYLFGVLGVPAAAVASGYLILRAMNLLIAWIPALMLWATLQRAGGAETIHR